MISSYLIIFLKIKVSIILIKNVEEIKDFGSEAVIERKIVESSLIYKWALRLVCSFDLADIKDSSHWQSVGLATFSHIMDRDHLSGYAGKKKKKKNWNIVNKCPVFALKIYISIMEIDRQQTYYCFS